MLYFSLLCGFLEKRKKKLNNKMVNKKLVEFIKEARKRGFDDFQIRTPLIQKGWPFEQVEEAFAFLKPRYKFKNKVSIFLDTDTLKIIEKRAKKNMLNIGEQIEDIIRRSCIVQKNAGAKKPEKMDDLLVSLFSRKR
jgi:hypothetical protein